MKIYPGASPEFRIFVDTTGEKVFQVRYVHKTYGYTGQWMDIPVVYENDVPPSAQLNLTQTHY